MLELQLDTCAQLKDKRPGGVKKLQYEGSHAMNKVGYSWKVKKIGIGHTNAISNLVNAAILTRRIFFCMLSGIFYMGVYQAGVKERPVDYVTTSLYNNYSIYGSIYISVTRYQDLKPEIETNSTETIEYFI